MNERNGSRSPRSWTQPDGVSCRQPLFSGLPTPSPWGGGVLLLVPAIVVALFLLLRNDHDGTDGPGAATAEGAVAAYVRAAEADDVVAAKKVLSGDASELIDNSGGHVFREDLHLIDMTVSSVEVDGDTATALATARFDVDVGGQNGGTLRSRFAFELEKRAGWLITSLRPI